MVSEDQNIKSKERIHKKQSTKRKIFIFIIFIIIIALIVVTGLYLGSSAVRLWMDKYIFRRDIGEENLPTIEINESEDTFIFAYGEYIATVANNTLSIYNNQASLVTTINVSITSPKFAANGKYLLLADDEGVNLYLIYNDSLQWHKEMEGDISQITVNGNGAVSVVLSGTTHKSVIVMYNINGNEEFRTYLSTSYATDVAISEDNKYLSFVEIKTSGTAIESSVKTISIETAKETPQESIIYTYTTNTNTLVLKIKYKNDKIVTYCDNSIHIFENGNDAEILKIDNKISFADINLDGCICSVTEGDSSQYELNIKNIENRKDHVYFMKGAVKNIYCNKDIVAVNYGNEVEFVNTNGWLVKKFTSIQNIRDITIADNVAGIIYKDKIEIVSL